ncbi:MAG: DUF4139 domain-containing protein [gamma proteobacterium symbiont of Bathyaustriella thionipta]|nr:DUF4139 domain-containing protein [gamma proteobacterium symbiont of Bathyaustriella thionipta]MCU7950855.1 DUF4139 domain-containing protein [gamma proteobacterium symbiont of Bathyaustriella thionipta]MCU7952750.1 DUF4139 domain-containing protein [gamma proteobacterium symbiont of Bathyaustriella thionipta]MCU7957469.1 DUF4139 domain-containing protein [gamma proteobacterium symbiont of Bathyaustriella thionipta]MCU7968692.1 DUF4139 domain-containing protein [gamma proteobacterium symbion
MTIDTLAIKSVLTKVPFKNGPSVNLSDTFFIIMLMSFISLSVMAKNIDLSTLPSRDSVQLTIYNSEDLTLVRETRQISIKKGQNRLQFSWANTKIDPTSVQLEFLSHPIEMHLSNTTFPHDKPQMLYWHITSSVERLATVEISYFTSGIRWQADYSAILAQSAKTMALDSFVTVTNHSGENYENAQVRLVIGKINLVERVNELVNRANYKKEQLQERKRSVRVKMAKKMMGKASGRYDMAPMSSVVMEDGMMAEKEVAKDSLSEYTIFTIEGTETISDQWAKRLRTGFAQTIATDIIYRYRPREYGHILARVLSFKNNKQSSLGEAPLPEGNIQIYQKNQQGSLTYIAGLTLKYTSIDDKVELNTGTDPDIHFELVNLKNWHDNIWMHYKKGNLYRRIGDGHIKIDHNSTVAGWNEHRLFVQHLRNFTDKPINVEIRRVISGDAVVKSQLDIKQHDFQTVDIHTRLAVGDKQELLYETLVKKGRNAKQNQLLLKNTKIKYPVW